jgi:carbonic anhydrase
LGNDQTPPNVASAIWVVALEQTVLVPVIDAIEKLFPVTQLEVEPVNAKLVKVPL